MSLKFMEIVILVFNITVFIATNFYFILLGSVLFPSFLCYCAFVFPFPSLLSVMCVSICRAWSGRSGPAFSSPEHACLKSCNQDSPAATVYKDRLSAQYSSNHPFIRMLMTETPENKPSCFLLTFFLACLPDSCLLCSGAEPSCSSPHPVGLCVVSNLDLDSLPACPLCRLVSVVCGPPTLICCTFLNFSLHHWLFLTLPVLSFSSKSPFFPVCFYLTIPFDKCIKYFNSISVR